MDTPQTNREGGDRKRDYIQVNMPGTYAAMLDQIADNQARETGHERMNRSETVRYAVRMAAQSRPRSHRD